jgi:hypothetical protein
MTPCITGLLLAADTVTLFGPSAGQDERGWAQPGSDPAWTGPGNLQLAPGPSDPRAAGGGGHGPYAPAAVAAGQLFLPPEAGEPRDGWTAQVRGRRWVLSGVRLVIDPADPLGGLSCWAADVTEAPGDEEDR